MISKIIEESKIQQAKKLVEKHDKIVIVTHVSPDGDAIGSSLGLFHYLQVCDKDVSLVIPDNYPQFLGWMTGSKDIIDYSKYKEEADRLIGQAELIFCLDFNDLKRLGEMEAAVVNSKAAKVMIDHHPHPADFCNVTISYPQICSTGELIFRFICRMGQFGKINLPCAEAIFVAMMTDTGAFTYNSESPEIYIIVAELIKLGVKKDTIYQKVFHTNTISRMKLMGYAMSEKLNIYPQFQVATIALTLDELKRFESTKGDTEGLVNMPLSIAGIRCSVFFRQESERIKLSFRSKGDLAVNRIAGDYFSGGGHKNAAGGEFYGTMEEAIALLEKVMPHYLALSHQ